MPIRFTSRLPALFALTVAVGIAACSDSTTDPGAQKPALQGASTTSSDTSHSSRDTASTPPHDTTPPRDTTHHDTVSTPRDSTPRDTTPRPPRDTASTPRDTLPVGNGTLWGMAVHNFVLQWRDAQGVLRDSVGYRGVAGVTVSVYAASSIDSTSGVPSQDRLVGTFTTDATGQFRTGALPDGSYRVRAALAGPPAESSVATAILRRGTQLPSIVFLNLR